MTEWVGWYSANRGPEFLHLVLPSGTTEAEALAHVPNSGYFNIPVREIEASGDSVSFVLRIAGRRYEAAAAVRGHRMSGHMRSRASCGSLELFRTCALDAQRYSAWLGDYEVGGHRKIGLYMNRDPEDSGSSAMCFYSEGDWLIRLYPVAPDRLVSESMEELVLPSPGKPDHTEPILRILYQSDESSATGLSMRSLNTWREESVTFQSHDTMISGTILQPDTPRPRPAVVLAHGASGGRRDFYRLYAAQFARRGIAALIFDKRGYGASAGNRDSTLADRAGDLDAGMTFLQEHGDVDADRVGLWGLSNGTWSVAMAASRRTDIAFVIVVGAPAVTMARSEIHRRAYEVREQGAEPEEVQAIERLWEIIFSFHYAGIWPSHWDSEYDALMRRVSESPRLMSARSAYAAQDPMLASIPPFRRCEEVKAVFTAPRPDLMYDPLDDYSSIRAPLLFMVGKCDQNVPAELSARRLEKAFQAVGKTNFLIRVFPDAGHSINCISPAGLHGVTTVEAGHRLARFQFVPGYLDLAGSWAARMVSR